MPSVRLRPNQRFQAELEVGLRYDVQLDDCCIVGQFTSVLSGIEYEPDDVNHEYPALKFDNGVTLTTAQQVSFFVLELWC